MIPGEDRLRKQEETVTLGVSRRGENQLSAAVVSPKHDKRCCKTGKSLRQCQAPP
jgi:hypothetical protein